MIQPFNERTEVSGNEYEDVGSNIGYGTIPFPPGHVPVLRVVSHFEGDDETTTSLRVSIANIPGRTTESGDFVPLDRDQDPRQTIVELTGQGTTQVYEEAYLTEFEDVVAGGAGGGTNGTEYPINTFIIEAKTGSVSGSSFVTDATTVSLELEAL
ncbi:hypothetical protein [Halobellus sp. GM3]|uniref:hypothetical protein n=1 Tax=Halobellus sp. GM3 TaxID=3458410 RepID=UPI00403D7C8A